MRGSFKMFLKILVANLLLSTCDAYFGLTAKGQLPDVWLLSSSLASSSLEDSDSWNQDAEIPQRSKEYKPVFLRPMSQAPKETGSKETGKRDLPSSYDRRRQASSRSTSNSLPYYRPGGVPAQREVPGSSGTHTHRPRDTQQASIYRRRPALSEEARFNLTRHLGRIFRRSQARIRNERESGKKRDLNALYPNPSSYMIASSFPNSQVPSSVNHRGLAWNRNQTQPRNHQASNFEPFLGLDDPDFVSRSDFMSSKFGNMTPLVVPDRIEKGSARKLCDGFKLTSSQRRKCKRDSGLPQVLKQATHMAAAECQYQFRFERWNCSLGSARIKLLYKGNKETAFLYSISSAGLTHTIAKSCASGFLERCSCDEGYRGKSPQDNWVWGGCGDNVRFAANFVRRFLRSRQGHRDTRAKVDKHNSDVGIRVVKSNVLKSCKCHGVSGSCTTKTCWNKLAPFDLIGKKLKRAYDKAVKVGGDNAHGSSKLVLARSQKRRQLNRSPPAHSAQQGPGGSRHLNSRPPSFHNLRPGAAAKRSTSHGSPKNKEMVYLENSPSYCEGSKLSAGTRGRICGKKKNCASLCCGRGHTTHLRIVRRTCNCQVQWCCHVQCDVCTQRKEIHTCK